ncbi:TetR family transcriptional regulator [Massilia sp. METH4]|uniref:TetR family transcriptional regulator n=1 Tax=Massilia sp. METH4 TaxID=3123041 RepID=UPI0030D55909
MPQPVPAKTPSRKTPAADALLAAACAIIAAEGLQGLTLRPLAERLGVSVTVLTNHYGNRGDLVAAICRAGSAQEATGAKGWRTLLAPIGSLPGQLAASVAEAFLDEQATRQRDNATLYFELLHAGTWDQTIRPALADWTAQCRAFWDDFGRRAAIPAPLIETGWWHGYMLAEGFYGLALDGDPSYRLLRRLGLQRVFAGGAARAADAADGILFDRLGERMRHAEVPATDRGTAPAWVADAARACGIRLAMQGVGAVTHRAVAADAGVAHTTLSYRFPTQHDLVVAGLESITAHVLSAVEAESLDDVERRRTAGDGARLDLARANLAVALAARRMPPLVPRLAHMRSRRGANLAKVLQKYLPGASGVDALCAQVMSLGLTGLTIAGPPGERTDAAVAAAFAAAARWVGR